MRKQIRIFLAVWVLVISAFFCSTAWADVSLSAFPDPAFRDILERYDRGYEIYDYESGRWVSVGYKDGVLSDREIANMPAKIVIYAAIQSLEGSQSLTGHTIELHYNGDSATLDLSGCTALTYLSCGGSLQLTSIDVSGCTALTYLQCTYHQLTSLNVSGCTALQTLNCEFNQLSSLNVSGCTALQTLYCYGNELTELDVSECAALTYLDCQNNKLISLDVSGCTALTRLDCRVNELTELDLSHNGMLTSLNCSYNKLAELDLSHNTALTDVNAGNQFLDGLKINVTSRGYEVDLKDYVSHIENISSVENASNYNAENGITVLLQPMDVKYHYQTHSPSDSLMYVTIKTHLHVEVLEDSSDTFTFGVIGISSISNDVYLDRHGSVIDEEYIYRHELNRVFGCTADGNSRLILNVQNDKPGTVTFFYSDSDGITLERLTDRTKLHSGSAIETCNLKYDPDYGYRNHKAMYYDQHQASAVLIAPESFPHDKNFPSDTFNVRVKFTPDDGSESEEHDLELTIEAAPVIMLPGMFNPGGFTNVFAAASILASAVNPGDSQHTFARIQQELLDRGFKKEHIAFWDHNGRQGIKNLVGRDYNHLFTILATMFDRYAQEGIVCTKADVIAQGMGGLIVREFLNEANKSNANDANNWSIRSYRQGMIHRVINISVPHMGTPLANVLTGDFSVLHNVAIGNDALAQTALWLLHNKYLKIYSDPFLKEIAVGSDFLNNLPLPANVPMHFVYGDVKGYLDSFEEIKDTAFMLLDLAKFAKSAGKNIDKLKKLDEYSDFVQFRNIVENSNPKNSVEMLQAINKLDDKILLRLPGQQKAIIWDMMTNKEIRAFALSFADMVYQNPILTHLIQIAQAVNDVRDALNPITLAFNLFPAMQRVIFSDQAHDMFVPVNSAIAGLQEYSTGFPEPGTQSWMDWRFRHSTLCQQGDVAYAVATILRRNDMNDFAILKKPVSLSSPAKVSSSAQRVKANSTDYGELNLEGLDLENLSVTNFVLTANQSAIIISDAGTSIVKFTANAKKSVSNDVQLVLQKDGLDRTFPMYTDDGKNFEINIEFASSDLGAMTAYCYTPNNKKLYVSNILQFSCIQNLDNVDITEISFFGTDTLYTNVNSGVPAGLYAIASDGSMYDVSSPLLGTKWTFEYPEFAKVNDAGYVVGLLQGYTNLTATYQNLSASVKVDVAAAIAYPEIPDDPEEPDEPEEIAPKILTTELTNGVLKREYSFQINANGTSPVNFTAKNLPTGLKISESGLIYGTPTKTATNKKFTVTATNNYGKVTQTFTLSVLEAPSITTASLKTGNSSKNYSLTLKAKGTKPLSWDIEGLPNGLTFNASKGTISGKTDLYGTFPVKITLSNPVESVTKTMDLTIKGVAPKISATLPSKKRIHEDYSVTFTATGSVPITWTLDGNLPDGLSFDANSATLGGVPAETCKNVALILTASNDVKKVSKTLKLTITGDAPKINTTKFENGIIGENYVSQILVSGDAKLSVQATNLPNGLTFDENTRTISGVPEKEGKFKVKITAENGVKKVTKTITLTVGSLPKILTDALPDATLNKSYSFKLDFSGTKTVKTYAAGLPNGIKLSIAGKFSGKTKASGDFDVTITARNSFGEVSKNFTLTVSESSVAKSQAPVRESTEILTPEDSELEAETATQSQKIITGNSRTQENLTSQEISQLDNYEIIAILPEIEVSVSGQYDFKVELNDNAEIGAKLFWFAFPDEPSEDDEIVDFLDENGAYIETVPENHSLTVSPWLNVGKIYRPVIAVKAK